MITILEPIRANENERTVLPEIERMLNDNQLGLVTPDGEYIELPLSVSLALQRAIYHLARGKEIYVIN